MVQIQWRPVDLTEAGREAQSVDKFILLDFFSPH
jgi:hypothetical protein